MSFGKTNAKPLDDFGSEQSSSPESTFLGVATPQTNIFALETPRWLSKAHYFEGPEFAEEESDVMNEEIVHQENIFKSCVRTKSTWTETSNSNSSQKNSSFFNRTKSVIVNKTDFSFANEVEESYNAKETFTKLHCLLLSKLKIGRLAYKNWFINWKNATEFKSNISEQRYSYYWNLQYVIEKFQGKAIENDKTSEQLDNFEIKTAFNRMKLRAEEIKKREIKKYWLVRRIYIKFAKKLEIRYKEAFQKIKIYGRIKEYKLEGMKKIQILIETHNPLVKMFKHWKDFKKDKNLYSYILDDGIRKNSQLPGFSKVEKGTRDIFQSLNNIRNKLHNKRQALKKDAIDLSSLEKIKDDIRLNEYKINQLIENQKKEIECSLDKELLRLNSSIEALNQEKCKSDLRRSILEDQIDILRHSNKKTENLALILKSSSSKLTFDKFENKHKNYRPISPTGSTRSFNSLPLLRNRNFLNVHSSSKELFENPQKIPSEPIRIKLKVTSSLPPLYLLFLSFIIGCILCYLIS